MTAPAAPPPSGPKAVDQLIVALGAAVGMRSLYAARHPNVVKGVERLADAVESACLEQRTESLTFLIVGEDLVVEQRPLRKASLYHEQLVHWLTRRGVERLTLARGLDAQEAAAFVEAMATAVLPSSSPHVILGELQPLAVRGDADHAGPQPGLASDRLEGARDAFTAFRDNPKAELRRVEEIVWGLMDALSRSTRELLPLAPLKHHDEYTFVHSVNVSLMTLAQARAFGFRDETLHGVGLASMLHDIGKLNIPLEVLNKPGKLEGREWEVMQSHAELGARHLCQIHDSQPLSIVVAYEHHMRFDGKPSYPATRTPRSPSLASQMTSISDVYDAICTNRPYSAAQPRDVAIGILRKRANTWHDPVLLASFAQVVGYVPPEEEPEP
jgi:HD-GYP domain-containing protein (c-di-GMP phosphodiesterase class II)